MVNGSYILFPSVPIMFVSHLMTTRSACEGVFATLSANKFYVLSEMGIGNCEVSKSMNH